MTKIHIVNGHVEPGEDREMLLITLGNKVIALEPSENVMIELHSDLDTASLSLGMLSPENENFEEVSLPEQPGNELLKDDETQIDPEDLKRAQKGMDDKKGGKKTKEKK